MAGRASFQRDEYIERLLECAICLERFNNPRLLPCQHTFCRDCLLKITDVSRKCLRCPTCRQLYRLPMNGVNGFPANLTLTAFLDLPAIAPEIEISDDEHISKIPRGRDDDRKRITCEQCYIQHGIGECFHCGKILCTDCRLSHRRLVILEIKGKLGSIKDNVRKVSDCLQAVRTLTELINTTNETTKDQVENTIDAFCRELQEQKNLLMHRLDFIQCNRIRSLDRQKERLEMKLGQLQDFHSSIGSKIDDSIDAVSDQELVNLSRRCSQQLGLNKVALGDITPSRICHSKRRRSTTPKGQRQSRSRSVPKTKTQSDGNEPSPFWNHEPRHLNSAEQDTETRPSFSTEASHTNDGLENRKPTDGGNTRQMSSENLPNPENAELLIGDPAQGDGGMFVHSTPQTVHTYTVQELDHEIFPSSTDNGVAMDTEEGEQSQYYGDEYCQDSNTSEIPDGIIIRAIIGKRGSRLWNPSALSISPLNGTVAVVDSYKNCVQVLDRDGHFLTSFGTVGSADGEFDYPHSCFCTQQDTIIVTDVFNHRVQIFTRFGQFLSKFGRLGSEDGQFEAPSGVAMDTTGRVFVADTNNCRLQVFKQNGAHLRTFGTPDTLPNDLHRPHYSFLVVSERGDVFVSDNKNHCIHKFHPTGQYQGSIGNHGNGLGQFNSPRGLALDRLGRLLVADRDNHRIQVFTQDGELIYSFGSQGDRAGQFHGPEGIAVANAGDVVVAECGGQRIQLFSFADLIQ